MYMFMTWLSYQSVEGMVADLQERRPGPQFKTALQLGMGKNKSVANFGKLSHIFRLKL